MHWSFQEAEAPRFQDNWHMKVVRLSALRPCHLYLHEIILVLISVRVWVNPITLVLPEGLCQWKFPMTPSGIEPGNFWFVAKRSNNSSLFNLSLIHHTFAIKQSELLALSFYKTQTSNSLCKLPIAHSSYITQSNRSSWYLQPTITTNSLCLVTHSKKWRRVIITVNVTIWLFKAADN
jgi:hypothetical protein